MRRDTKNDRKNEKGKKSKRVRYATSKNYAQAIRNYLRRPLRPLPPRVVIGFLERGTVFAAAVLDVTDFAVAAFAGFLTASFFPLAVFPLAFFEATLATATFAVEVDDSAFPFSVFWVPAAPMDFLAGTPFLTVPAFPFVDTRHKFCSPVHVVKVVKWLAGTLCVSLNDLPKSDCFTSKISSGSLQ